MNYQEKANLFANLHTADIPLVLYNIWDAGGARAVAKAGAQAIATGSWSVAESQGYSDGELIPLDLVVGTAKRICNAVDLPVTIDFEGAYSTEPELLAANTKRIVDAGAVGVNFEDQIVGGSGLHTIDKQSTRIVAMRAMADEINAPLYINARTDLFLKAASQDLHKELLAEAKERASAYAEAGASGFFVPGLSDEAMIKELCEHSTIPVNIMMLPSAPSVDVLGRLGVARISYGPGPYRAAMKALQGEAANVY
jgi:2-methylisocitrate lyase-like PEP mutase family enzyme